MRSFDSLDNSGTAPKAYVGLFGDNSVAALDLASNQVIKTIPTPHRSARTGHDARRQACLRQQ